MIFSSPNAFHLLNHEGLLEILRNISSTYGVKTRILVELDKQIKELVQKLRVEKQKIQIDIRHIYNSPRIGITTIIIDADFSLIIEMKDDVKKSLFREAVGLSSYSNSESTVSSYTSIFENLWILSELQEQKIKYFFSNFLIIMNQTMMIIINQTMMIIINQTMMIITQINLAIIF
jgi:hypothetical protein